MNARSSESGVKRTTTGDIAEIVSGTLQGPEDLLVNRIVDLEDACESDITFVADTAHARRWASSSAAAALVSRGIQVPGHDPDCRALIEVDDAEIATIRLLGIFAPAEPMLPSGIDPEAVVAPDAMVAPDACVGPHVSIGAGATIGARTVIHAGARIYSNVSIGHDCVVHANVVIRERCTIGTSVIIHQNASIGADGFGFRPDPDGSGLLKVPHVGSVVIEDDVEIGAGTCIDRGKFGATIIGAGTKLDNLVQIGHNCRIGRCCVIAGQAGLSGSVIVEDGVMIGGQAGVADHIHIGKGARIGAQSGVIKNVPAGATQLGYPAHDRRQTLHQWSAIRKLPGLIRLLGPDTRATQ